MARYRKKPIEVEAVQWWKHGDHPAVAAIHVLRERGYVNGRQGAVEVKPGDWLIAEQDGKGFYPCAPDVFEATYEPA